MVSLGAKLCDGERHRCVLAEVAVKRSQSGFEVQDIGWSGRAQENYCVIETKVGDFP